MPPAVGRYFVVLHVCSLVEIAAQAVLGNGGAASEDRVEVLGGKSDWSLSSLESADKKSSNEISGWREHGLLLSHKNKNMLVTDALVCLSVCRGHTELLEGHRRCGFTGGSGDQHQHRADADVEWRIGAQRAVCLTRHRYESCT